MNQKELFYQNLKQTKIWLHFNSGKRFSGFINLPIQDKRLESGIFGEAAFTTGMSGYQETMTDPSFLGQHIVFTTAHVGNYEASKDCMQSQKCHASSLIARNFSYNDFLSKTDVPLITLNDTRDLVKYLVTEKKSHNALITVQEEMPDQNLFQDEDLVCNDLEKVSTSNTQVLAPGENPIVIMDYGCKQSIKTKILELGHPVVLLPHNSSAKTIKEYNPRMILLSNGPGDPEKLKNEIAVVKELITSNIPVRGICLGHQLIGLAMEVNVIKLPFGQRGITHPCFDHINNKTVITSQNHGYALCSKSFEEKRNSNILSKEFFVEYSSLFDQSIEGISSTDGLIKSVQFHPEAGPGPSDAFVFFDEIQTYLKQKVTPVNSKDLYPLPDYKETPKKGTIEAHKILIIGSGPIKIGQASEFDYSGTQALKALRALNYDVTLLNSNPATIMTDAHMASQTYIEPITKETIKKIILKEKIEAVLSTMGGQTALNLCIDLEEEGFLKKHNVSLLGAKVETINKTEDRDLFAKELDKLGYQTGKRFHAKTKESAVDKAKNEVGFPLIIRRDYALGGKGAALVENSEHLEQLFRETDVTFPITMERSLLGWKEIELEVMVDSYGDAIIICSIENIDACGVHTGDSITVAPAQTISDKCYQQLRTMSLTIAKHMGVVAGGANVQFAIDPTDENNIIVIEMNPRVSRSSALASKATGYPIAKISAMLAVGLPLKSIMNDITKASPVAFEPTLDYVAVKIPIFPFEKFPTSPQQLGPQMRSVGEVLALGGSFNEAFMKALRSLEMGLEIPTLTRLKTAPIVLDQDYLKNRLEKSQQLSLVTALEALRQGISIEEVSKLSKISPWFIDQINILNETENQIVNEKETTLGKESLLDIKKLGFSDKHIAFLINQSVENIYKIREKFKIFPIYKSVDTCSGEFIAKTPYFYSTYSEANEALPFGNSQKTYAILGSGPNRIGQGIEFDYSCVKACQYLREQKQNTIMINSNPETVSTDYDSSDRLYLSALYSEDLFDIFRHEQLDGVITSFSGQTGIKVRKHIEESFRSEYLKVPFLGSPLKVLDLTEDRKMFSEITKETSLKHTKSAEVKGYKKLTNAFTQIGMPVIIRPSYVIGGESMYIFHSHDDLEQLPESLMHQLQNNLITFQVETYLENAIEYDVDLIRDQFGNTIFTVCEHIEHAGVHSGDSGMISPPTALNSKLYQEMKKIAVDLATKLEILGPINFQFATKDDSIYCIEANPRGSRTFPFLSKAYDINLPAMATKAMLGEEIPNWDKEYSSYFYVKQSTFPFDRFLNDNIILGPKMRSTGETFGMDKDKDQAILKSYLGNYPKINKHGKILMSLANRTKDVLPPYLKQLHKKGYEFIATTGTYNFIKKQGFPCEKVSRIGEDGRNLLNIIEEDNIVLVFNTPENQGRSKSDGELIRNTAIQYGIPCFTRKENIKAIIESVTGVDFDFMEPVSLQESVTQESVIRQS